MSNYTTCEYYGKSLMEGEIHKCVKQLGAALLAAEARADEAESCLARSGWERSADVKTWKPPVNLDAYAPKFFEVEAREAVLVEVIEDQINRLRALASELGHNEDRWTGKLVAALSSLPASALIAADVLRAAEEFAERGTYDTADALRKAARKWQARA